MNRRYPSLRLQGYDYSQPGSYFVTICIKNKRCLFGEIKNCHLEHSKLGSLATGFWLDIPQHFPTVRLDTFVVMPNHIHALLTITDCLADTPVGVQYIEPLPAGNRAKINRFQHIIPKSLGSIIRSYKAAVTRLASNQKYLSFAWQRNYYEHIVRNERSLERIREYIINNPLNWNNDLDNTAFKNDIDENKRLELLHNHYEELFFG